MLIKDNHLAAWVRGQGSAVGGQTIADAVRRARCVSPGGIAIEVEVDTLDQLRDALAGGPDIVLLDLRLPDISGFEVCREIRQRSNVPIIIVTAQTDTHDLVAGLEAGADDYITKPFSPKELLARIKAVLRRRAPQLTDEIIVVKALTLDPAAHRVTAEGCDVALGPTEFKLLHFFMTHPERVYSRVQLLDQVWGDHVFVEERTVDVHIRRLRTKIELDPANPRYVVTVRGLGYRLDH